MSCVEKMMIQGIRSFGPDEDDKQQIYFFSPLTLILGPNGTGKTTIIECLKYITTGDLPPGGRQNAAFIHDPKIANETEVMAQVKLQFRDVRGKVHAAQRSLTATQKPKKTEMKTLEGVISTRDKTGKLVSISSKCAEMDREMVTLLGVAKPILDSVIFCHQEDANWPLSEGKALKARFDDIFASTRYVKALDVIRKTAKLQTQDIKLFQSELKYLKLNREKAKQIQAEYDENKTRYLSSCESVAHIKEKMKPISDQLEIIRTREHDIYKIQSDIEKMEAEISLIEKTQAELRSNIKNEIKGSDGELKQALQDFNRKIIKEEDRLHHHEGEIEELVNDLDELGEEKAVLLVEQGVLREEAQRYQKNIQGRDKLISELANEYSATGFTGILSDAHVARFLKFLQAKQQEMEKELQQKRTEQEEHERVIQIELDEMRNKKTKVETELSMKQETLNKNQTEVREIKRALVNVEASAEHLQVIRRDLKNVENELIEAKKTIDLDAIKAEIKTTASEKMIMDEKLKYLDDELIRVSRESTGRAQLDNYKKDKATKLESTRKLKSKIDESFQHLLGQMPTDNLRRPLEQCISQLGRQLRNTNDQLQKLKQEKARKETQCKMQKELLSAKEVEVRDYQERLSTVSGNNDFDAGLDQLQASLKKSQEEKGNLKGVQYMYKKYKDSLHSKDPPCPLCHRSFDDQNEVEELINEIQQKMNMVPDKLERASNKIDQYKHKVEEMLQLKPVRAAMMDLENDDIPSLKKKITVLNDEIEKLQEEISDKEDEVEILSSDEHMAQMIQSDAAMIDRLQNELKDFDKKINQQASLLSGGGNDRSMQDVQEEKLEVQDKIEMMNRNLDRKRQKLTEKSEHIQSLHAKENKLNSQKLQIEKGLQQTTQLEDTKVKLESENEILISEIKDGKKELQPLQESIHNKEKTRLKVTRLKEKQYEEGMKRVNAVNDEQQDLVRRNHNIESYVRSGKENDLKESIGRIEVVERKAVVLSNKKDQIVVQIDQLKENLVQQKMRERELSDNLMVYQKQCEIEALRERIEKEQKKLQGLDVNNLQTERSEKENKYQRYLNEKHQAESRKTRFEENMKIREAELKEDMYKDAEEKYRDKMIASRTTELAQKDLDKYYKALDRTIMSYHTTKMADINKIIRELWRNTYKGNDIETIEIRSDEEESSGASKTRRTYNYRVVMIRGGVSIDMRNRCSAGQKVLASLIIRLALAETFCINCGILALDEPTTNLDRENIESLAYALVEIIKSRSKQRNFQLVIITHDEDFVELLGRSDYVEEFFKVRKNEFGCSRLVRARVSDLHTR